MKPIACTLLAVAVATALCSAQAGVILQDTSTINFQIDAFSPIGQSFTAEDSVVSFAFFVVQMNPGFPVDAIQFTLRSGDGLGGQVLYQASATPTTGFNNFFDVDLSSVVLTVGQMYTVQADIPSGSPYWGAEIAELTNPYLGGRSYFANISSSDPVTSDWRFRVTPTASVPEPGTLVVAAVALAALAVTRRRL